LSGRVQGCVWDHAEPGDAVAKLVLLCLAEHARDNGWCNPSIRRIADRCLLGRTAVKDALRRLRIQEMVWAEPGHGRRSSDYIILDFPRCHTDPTGCSRTDVITVTMCHSGHFGPTAKGSPRDRQKVAKRPTDGRQTTLRGSAGVASGSPGDPEPTEPPSEPPSEPTQEPRNVGVQARLSVPVKEIAWQAGSTSGTQGGAA
jgi:hypothetical protein